ncbi:MAG: response regulator [Bacteroidota bacterium]
MKPNRRKGHELLSKYRSVLKRAKRRPILRIVLADDHAVVRRGLRSLLSRSRDMKVVGEAADGQHLLEVVARSKPTIVILDISMPILTGVEAARILKERYPELKILMLTVHQNEEYISQVLRADADGYLLKNAGSQEIFAAIRAVARGRKAFSDGVSKVILGGFVKQQEEQRAEAEGRTVLSDREKKVLHLIAQGLTSKEIASELFISLSTVNTHRTNLMKKLRVHDKASLVRYALQAGLLKL